MLDKFYVKNIRTFYLPFFSQYRRRSICFVGKEDFFRLPTGSFKSEKRIFQRHGKHETTLLFRLLPRDRVIKKNKKKEKRNEN